MLSTMLFLFFLTDYDPFYTSILRPIYKSCFSALNTGFPPSSVEEVAPVFGHGPTLTSLNLDGA